MGDGLLREDRWAPSQRPYAFRPETMRAAPGGVGHIIEALWVGRKKGATTVTLGTLTLYSVPRTLRPETYSEMLAVADMRYGGDWRVQWDGTSLQGNPARGRVMPWEYPGLVANLDTVLRALPAVPDGWDGWYYRGRRP